MNKYQYDDVYFIAEESEVFLTFSDYEEEEAYARHLIYGKH